jgi:hypothetical protein
MAHAITLHPLNSANGEILEVTVSRFIDLLADKNTFAEVLGNLYRLGSLMVDLTTGPALARHELVKPPALPPHGLNDFIAHAKISFSVPARINVRAGAPSQARHLVLDYVHGRQPPPPDFSIEIDGLTVETFLCNLEIGNFQGVEDIEVTAVDPRPLLLAGR